MFWEISKELDSISFDGNNEIFFPNRSIKEIHFANLITSSSSNDSALLIETDASDHAWEIFETKIQRSAIFMCSRECEFQLFEVGPEEFKQWEDKWAKRVEEFYNLS